MIMPKDIQHHIRTKCPAKRRSYPTRVSVQGFTLIELLVVISIIGFLSSVIFASLSSTRERGRVASAMKTHVSAHRALGAEAVGVWDLNEGSGTTANDGSGYGNHGTLMDGPIWVCDADPDDPPTPYHVIGDGDGRCSLRFTTDNNRLEVPNTNGMLSFKAPPFSYGAWFYPQGYGAGPSGGRGTILSKRVTDPSAGYNYGIRIHEGQNRLNPFSTGCNPGSATAPIPKFLNNWHHVMVVYESETTAKVYINGKLDSTRSLSDCDPIHDTASPLYIGSIVGSTYSWDGKITDVRIYTQALTASEVQKLYAEGVPKFMASEQ